MGGGSGSRRMKGMRRVLALALLATALVAAPAARLAATAPCPGPAAMDCCAGMSDDNTPPCHCALKPVPPAPAAVDATPVPAVVFAEVPRAAVEAEAPAAASSPARVAPRARSAPLFLLFSVLLV